MLAESPDETFNLIHMDRLKPALEQLATDAVHVVLLDLRLPDGDGFENFMKVRTAVPDIPILVLTGLDDSEVAIRAVQEGAQDYLIKGQLDGRLLSRSIRYSMERHRLQTELEQSRQQQLHHQKLESLGVLAGGIAHDFNNLLAVILGHAELAMRDIQPASPAHKSLDKIQVASQRATDLCSQLLAYSGKGHFVIQALNVNATIEEISQLLRLSVSKNVSLKYHFAPDLPSIEGDPAHIRQVTLNLVKNASEAICEKNGTITITTRVMNLDAAGLSEMHLTTDLLEGRYVCVEVADTGCGMDVETQTRIFDPFFTTKFTGRGLGLASVLGIVRGHKGALKVFSELGRGSTFQLLFPCVEGSAGGSKTPQAVSIKNSPVESSPSGELQGAGTVLVVDDEDNIRMMAAQIIEMFGFKVLTASDGLEAVKTYRAHTQEIVLVLLDLTMPGMSGMEILQAIHRIKPEVRILVMSGYNEEEAGKRVMDKDVAGFIQKPFTIATLREKISWVTGV